MQIVTRIGIDSPGQNRWDRALTFFGHLDCRVYLRRDAWIDVGAGSLQNARRVEVVLGDHQGSVGRIGRYCEFAHCTVMSAGDHENDRPVNIGFGGMPVIHGLDAARSGLKPAPMIDIGHGVVISRGAKILPGVAIGDGAVIGAGAVVNKPAEAFGVYAGVPARKLRDRMKPETIAVTKRVAWWNFTPGYIAANLRDIQALAVTESEHVYLQPDGPRLVLTIADGLADTRVLGVQYPDGGRLLERCEPSLQAYVEHAFGPGPYEWVADPLAPVA